MERLGLEEEVSNRRVLHLSCGVGWPDAGRCEAGVGIVAEMGPVFDQVMKRILAVSAVVGWTLTGLASDAPRAARSVHLAYEAPEAGEFRCGMTVEKTTPGSFFMACGWDTGYFGLQELGTGRKVVIFSVWDPTKGDDPHAVPAAERVECLFQAPHVRIKRFGGEGTGAQCMADFEWNLGEEVEFLVSAETEGEFTSYTGFVKRPADGDWERLVTFRVKTGGRLLQGAHSFLEDFRRDGRSATESRRASFGRVAVKVDGEWRPVRKARFTASSSEWEARDTIDAGSESGRLFLATGGDTVTGVALGSEIALEPADAQR